MQLIWCQRYTKSRTFIRNLEKGRLFNILRSAQPLCKQNKLGWSTMPIRNNIIVYFAFQFLSSQRSYILFTNSVFSLSLRSFLDILGTTNDLFTFLDTHILCNFFKVIESENFFLVISEAIIYSLVITYIFHEILIIICFLSKIS